MRCSAALGRRGTLGILGPHHEKMDRPFPRRTRQFPQPHELGRQVLPQQHPYPAASSYPPAPQIGGGGGGPIAWVRENKISALMVLIIVVATIGLIWWLRKNGMSGSGSNNGGNNGPLDTISDPELRADAIEFMRLSRNATRPVVRDALSEAAHGHLGDVGGAGGGGDGGGGDGGGGGKRRPTASGGGYVVEGDIPDRHVSADDFEEV